jgi:hypothetical protein
MSSPGWLCTMALLAGGCAESEAELRSSRAVDAVQLGSREPGAGCRTVETVEVSSHSRDTPSSAALAAYAASLGANYVTVATFNVYDESDEDVVLTRARLFSCPLSQLAAVP